MRVASSGSDELALTGTQATLEAWVQHTGATGSATIVVGRQLGAILERQLRTLRESDVS